MPTWTRRSAGTTAASTSTTITFAAADVNALLVLVVGGGATHSFPAGWTERLQPLNYTELSVATKTATAGESSVVVTNGSALSQVWVLYEFPAGSTWAAGVGAAARSTNLPVTGLPGTAVTVIGSFSTTRPDGAPSAVWSGSFVEDVDQWTTSSSEGYMTVGYLDGVTATSSTPTVTITNGSATGRANGVGERVSFAINVAAPAPSGVTGTGALLGAAASLAAAAVIGLTGTGGLTSSSPSLAGAGTLAAAGGGALAVPSPTLAGSGASRLSGTGSLTATPATLAGAAVARLAGTGTLTAPTPALSGTGAVGSLVGGGGTLTATPPTLAGTGTLQLDGGGALSPTAPGLVGAGQLSLTAAGTLAAPAPSLSGSAAVFDASMLLHEISFGAGPSLAFRAGTLTAHWQAAAPAVAFTASTPTREPRR